MNYQKKNKDRQQHRRDARDKGQVHKFHMARTARREAGGAFGRAEEADYAFLAFGTNAGRIK